MVILRVVGSQSNDARMTRWPFQFSAAPLLHQVWGLNPADFQVTGDLVDRGLRVASGFDRPGGNDGSIAPRAREFIVDSVLKGTDPTALRVRLPGGDVRGVTMMFEELPEITPGRRYIMFLTQRETPTQEGSEVAWTITRYEGVFEEGAGGNWRNQTYARETTVQALQRLMQ